MTAPQPARVHEEIPGSGPAQILHVPFDTAEFFLGWKKFFDSRREKYQSNVFRTAVVFPAITILDIRGFRVLFDESLVKKHYGFGPAIPRHELAGTVPTVFTNNPEHEGQKQFILEWLRRSMPQLLPSLKAAAEPFLARWEAHPPHDWGSEFDVILSNALFDWLLGAHPDASCLLDWISDIVAPIPYDIVQPPASHKAAAARDRMMASIEAAPRFAEAAELGASLAGWTRDETARQLRFYICWNAWGGLRSTIPSLMAELGSRPEIQQRVHAEAAAGGQGWPPLNAISSMETLRGSIGETLRLHGAVSFAYGEAIRDFEIQSSSGSFPVKKGEMLQGVFLTAGRDPDDFPEPDRFDPLRYRDPAQAEGLIWANGMGSSHPSPKNKTCAGKDAAPLILALLTARIASSYRWELAAAPEWDDVKVLPGNVPKEKVALKSFVRI